MKEKECCRGHERTTGHISHGSTCGGVWKVPCRKVQGDRVQVRRGINKNTFVFPEKCLVLCILIEKKKACVGQGETEGTKL